jgi:putative addiction module killer protein
VTLTVRQYVTNDGKRPFALWLSTLDTAVRGRVQARVLRFASGNLGDHKTLLNGLWEARLPFGPGYRIYFGRDGAESLVLLLGGSKASQREDIWRARQFWGDYLDEGGDSETK